MALIARGQISLATVEDGSSPVIYSLLPSATAVKKDKAGVVSPATVSCQVELRVGNEREVIGVDPKIEFKGRNLLPNTAGVIERQPGTYGQIRMKTTTQQIKSGQTYIITADIETGAAPFWFLWAGSWDNAYDIRLGVPFTSPRDYNQLLVHDSHQSTLSLLKFKNIKLEQGSASTDWTPAPEDYTIRRDGQSYTAGTAVAPTDTINWSLHDPSKATQAEPIGRASTIFTEDIEVGGVNLALNSKDFSFYTRINLADKLVAGEVYTLSIGKSTSLSGSQTRMLLYNHNPISDASSLNYIDFGESKRLTFIAVASNLLLYAGELWASGNSAKIEKLMLTRGNRATDWSPAPQDVQTEIDSAQASAEAAKAEALAVETRTKAYADGKVTASETYAIQMAEQYATAAREAAQLAAAVYADGIITEAEARALADATAKAAAAKEAAIEAANQAAAAAEAAAKAEAVQRQNDLAASIGYASWADLEATAATGQTIIEGGRINTELIETAALVAKLLHADSGFIDKLTVNSLMTPGREVEINATRAKFGAAEVQGDGSVAIKNTSGDEITKLVRGEIDDLDTILGKNQNTGDVAIPQLGGNGELLPSSGSWENPQWTVRETAAAVTAAYDGTTITIKGASMSLGAGLYVPGTYVQIRIKAELRNALGGSWIIAEQTVQYYYDYPERNTTIPLARTFTGMPKGAYRLVISAVIQSWNGDWTTAGQLAASFGGGGGTMSAVFTNAANQSILGRGLSVMRSATEFLHLGWDKALGAVGGRKWGLTYRGAMDIPGVLAQYKVSSNGTIFNASRFGAKARTSGDAGHPSAGVYVIYHNIGHANYSVSVAFEKFHGFWSVQAMAANSVTIHIVNHQNNAYADPNFYITITGNN